MWSCTIEPKVGVTSFCLVKIFCHVKLTLFFLPRRKYVKKLDKGTCSYKKHVPPFYTHIVTWQELSPPFAILGYVCSIKLFKDLKCIVKIRKKVDGLI